jgi:hypothetical protein
LQAWASIPGPMTVSPRLFLWRRQLPKCFLIKIMD